MTHRQFQAWTAWNEAEWNKPDRNDQYIMQLSQIVLQLFSKKRIPLKKLLLTFPERGKKLGKIDKKVRAAWSAAQWLGLASGGGEIKIVEGSTDLAQEYYDAIGASHDDRPDMSDLYAEMAEGTNLPPEDVEGDGSEEEVDE
jgi:hypothetical protein